MGAFLFLFLLPPFLPSLFNWSLVRALVNDFLAIFSAFLSGLFDFWARFELIGSGETNEKVMFGGGTAILRCGIV